MAQEPAILRAEVYACALRASQNVKRAGAWVGVRRFVLYLYLTRAPWDRTRQANRQEKINHSVVAIAAVELVKVVKSSFFVYVRGCLSGAPTAT